MLVERIILETIEKRIWVDMSIKTDDKRQCTTENTEWKRRRGKRRECWMDGVKRSMERRGLHEEDAMDRDLWRQIIIEWRKTMSIVNYFLNKKRFQLHRFIDIRAMFITDIVQTENEIYCWKTKSWILRNTQNNYAKLMLKI